MSDMLTIYLHRSQQTLLPTIKERWPDLALARSLYPNFATYRIGLAPTRDECLAQKTWLVEHHVLYMDREALRLRRIRAVFQHTLLEPEEQRSPSVSFTRVERDDPSRHRVRLRSRHSDQAVTLYLDPDWSGHERAPFDTWVGPLWVCRGGEHLHVYCVNERGLLSHIVRCFSTEEELLCWLLEQRYLHLYCFSFTADICGLYCRIHDDGLPDLARVDA
jgi:hypothetical protein